MDKQKSILNISVSLCSRILLLAAALIVRRLLIQHIGNEVNGLDSLYSSIIGILAVAELGVGSAIVFSMYSPIVEGQEKQVAALYCFYKKAYRIIGGVILAAGLIVMPFLPKLIGDYEALTVNVYSTYVLTLLSVVLSYLYSAKTSLIEAHKDNYQTTGILTIAKLIRYSLQIMVILIWASYTVYIVCQIIETLLVWGMTETVVRKKYGSIISRQEDVDPESRYAIIRNVKAMFMHRIGTVMVNTVDSVIISTFIGVAILGKYTNYTLIAGVLSGTISLFFSPLTSVIGHLYASGDREQTKKYFDYLYCVNYVLGLVCYLGYYAVVESLVRICFGPGLEISRTIVFIITLNQFTKYMRSATLLFRDASGAFYYDRWKPIGEGICNLILSLLFVHLFPEHLKVAGVIAATILTTLVICDIVDPYVVYKHVFHQPTRRFCLKNYTYIGIFTLCLAVMTYLIRPFHNDLTGIVVNGCISIGLSAAALGLLAAIDKAFRRNMMTMGKKVGEWWFKHSILK